MTDTSDSQDSPSPTELREDVDQELDELVETAADEERARMAERDEQGVDDPS
jgi:hypothetical protein